MSDQEINPPSSFNEHNKHKIESRFFFESEEKEKRSNKTLSRDFEESKSLYRDINDRRIGLANLPDQFAQRVSKLGVTYTLMVAGTAGVGKTSFINTLFQDFLKEPNKDIPSPTETLTLKRYLLSEDDFSIQLNVVDTPGFGNRINNSYAWVPLCYYIDNQLKVYMLQSEQPDRKKLVDTRVHCCIYFLQPAGLTVSPLDIASMKELSKRVNIVPVISKSDSYSPEYLKKIKTKVKALLTVNNIPICDLLSNESVTEEINGLSPFAIISSNNYHINSNFQKVRGRKYQWGIAEVDNDLHCDFTTLRNVLIKNNMLDLITSTELHYERYREKCLQRRIEHHRSTCKDLKNGLDHYKLYHEVGLEIIDQSSEICDFALQSKEQNVKDKLKEAVIIQERKFKEWKCALIGKQDKLNADIEKCHDHLVSLQLQVDMMENGLESSKPERGDENKFTSTEETVDEELFFN